MRRDASHKEKRIFYFKMSERNVLIDAQLDSEIHSIIKLHKIKQSYEGIHSIKNKFKEQR